MPTTYTKDNDYTLRVEDELTSQSNFARALTRIFNFRSQQVTSIYNDWILTTGGSGTSSQMDVKNFNEIQSQDEIRLMREKLVELNGNPPELDDAALPKKNLRQLSP